MLQDADVQSGRVRLEDQLGNAEADAAADLGRRHQSEVLIDARRSLLKARSYWYPIMPDLHRFMIAVAWVTVNHDGRGGTAPDPFVWDQGGRRKVRRTDIRVNVDLSPLPWPSWFLGWALDSSSWEVVFLVLILLPGLTVLAFSVNLLLIYRVVSLAYGFGGYGSFWSLLSQNFLSFSSNGLVHRLLSEMVTRPRIRANRPVLITFCSCVRGN